MLPITCKEIGFLHTKHIPPCVVFNCPIAQLRRAPRDNFTACALIGNNLLPINTVHDAIYMDCATEELAKEYGAMVSTIMGETPKWLTEQIPAYKDWRYDSTPFPAVGEYGANMLEKQHIE